MEQPSLRADRVLLGSRDPAPMLTLNTDSLTPILLVCDHASNRVPESLRSLGLDADSLSRHIALDKGAGELTQLLAERLGYQAILGSYSRLVVDCNRRKDDPSVIAEVSDHVPVPGNNKLSEEHRNLRFEQIYDPYHAAITQSLDSLQKYVTAPALIAIHSFTPQLVGNLPRPWDVGILWDKDDRLSTPFLDHLRRETDLCVGDNQPYSGAHPADYTIDHHGEGRGLPCASIEIRQDLLATESGLLEWVDRLAKIMLTLQDDKRIYEQRRKM